MVQSERPRQPKNLVFFMADEHTRAVLGCYGNRVVQTPNIDALAARGTLFSNAYTPSPVCVSARASLATGRWVHQTRCWSSAEPYDGSIPGWGHQLLAAGHRVDSIGKLHFRRREDSNGFSEEFLPLHVVGGVGWLKGLLRQPLPDYEGPCRELAEQVGVGETGYSYYDQRIADAACTWLRRQAVAEAKPWVLFVSFVSPHYPLIAPEAFFGRHDSGAIGLPHRPDETPSHPVLQEIYRFYDYKRFFTQQSMETARRGYYGLCALVDHLVGEIVSEVEALGLADETRFLYTSDHGEMLGNHGMWTKMLMNEESAGIPLILAGPDVPEGKIVDTPASLVDCHPTILEALGHTSTAAEQSLPGVSLFDLANGDRPQRTVLSEYHDGGSPTGYFMVRQDEWKYVYYAGSRPQLFDLRNDPLEDNDLGESPAHRGLRGDCEALLREILDPDQVNAAAFADQASKVDALGGRDAILAQTSRHFGFTPLDDLANELDLEARPDLQY